MPAIYDRRSFMRAAAIGGTAYAFGRAPREVRAQMAGTPTPGEYRALVCVFLFGGNDSFNMVVPRSNAEYNVYAASRQNLAIPQGSLLPLNPLTPDPGGTLLGMHPSLAELATLFEQDRTCAVVANIGPLLAPTNKAQYQAKSVPLPPQLFSHNDQQDQWHSLKGRSVSRSGWAGRMADALQGPGMSEPLSMNISLAGQSLFQTGDATVSYTMGTTGPVNFTGLSGTDSLSVQRRAAFDRLIRSNYLSPYERTFAQIQQRALQAGQTIGQALTSVRTPNAPAFTTVFPNTPLGNQLKTVAEMIAVRDRLGMSRQVFFVSTGGFDTHDDQVQDQPGLLSNIGASMAAFYRATVAMGVASKVTAFTQSDFGRTLTSNGDGTDHGWGGIQLVVGGAVLGRNVYGRYPLLQINGADDAGSGRMIPGVSADQYAATLARWFGVPDSRLPLIAPSIANFAQRDLGFLA